MRYGICASDCKTFTTNLWKREVSKHEKKMVFYCAAGDSGNGRVRLPLRPGGATTVELAAAAAVWLARNHLLASARTAGAEPHPFWAVRWTRLASRTLAASHGRALPQHDPRRA